MSGSGDLAQTLAAGGLVPVNAKLGKDEAVDNVVARAYQHAVMPGRTIVRLTAEGVAAGDDLEMAVLGFGAGETRGVVGKERRRPLGFPGWALVHDPKNARYALDVVKEFKKSARKAKSKPGAAKEGIDAIAEKLGKSVPQFLPSFFEEAGRVFIEHGSPTYAAAMFGKAREAEAVHALEVDEQHRVDGFLEFALAGAVTTKALTQYAKDLSEGHEPEVAYGHFRQLCVQRTLGGMPPWSGMAKELAKLAKAAKLDPAAEASALVADIIDSPALAKGANEFWRAYQAAFAELGKRSPAVRGVLLNLFPTGNTYSAELDEVWLELLAQTDAFEALVADTAPAEAAPTGGRAAWFDRFTVHLGRGRKTIDGTHAASLLRRMAPRLVADGKPIACIGRYHQIDLDLLELALELGVPVRRASDHARFQVGAWAGYAKEPEHGRDPVLTAAHPVFGPLLIEAVAREIGDEPFDSLSLGKAGFLDAKRTWLLGNVDRAERGGMLALEEVITVVGSKIKPATFAELPDLLARFAAIDPARSLARSLRIGIPDELGWPALEAAATELAAEVALHGGLPAIVLTTKTKAIAVGPRGRLGEHDLVIPPKHELHTVRFIGGQFLVILKESYSAIRAYWSSAPHDVFAAEGSTWSVQQLVNRTAVLPDGAWLEGARAIRAGDRLVPMAPYISASDGTTVWVGERSDGAYKLREMSPTGEPGRWSLPSFLEAGDAADERRLDVAASYVLPAPAELTSSPLGLAGGLVGMRVRVGKPEEARVPDDRGTPGDSAAEGRRGWIERIDGVTWTGKHGAVGLVTLPGGGPPRPYVEESGWREGTGAVLLDPTGELRGSRFSQKQPRYRRGSVASYPPALWHALEGRDEAGSRRLRAITDDEARALLALVPADPDAEAKVAARIGEVLPDVTHARLRAGIAGLVVLAAEQATQRDKIARERKAGGEVASGPDDALLATGLAMWMERSWGSGGSAGRQLALFGELCRSTERADRSLGDTGSSPVGWLELAAAPAALAVLATAIGTPPASRAALAALLEIVAAEMPVAHVRLLRTTGTPQVPGLSAVRGNCDIRWFGGNAYAMRTYAYGDDAVTVLEYAPDGGFKPLPGVVVVRETRAVPISADEARAVRAATTTSWSEAAVARLSELTGLSPSEGAILWAGYPQQVGKELREELGLKAAQVELGRSGLATVPLAKRLAVIAETGRAGVTALLDGSAVDVMAAAWNRIVGARVPIPEELIADADREVLSPIEPSLALAMLGAAAESPQLQIDAYWGLASNGAVIRTSKAEPLVGQTKSTDDSPAFTSPVLHMANAYVPFLYAELPVGDPLRALAATAHEAVLARLANPSLLIDSSVHHLTDEQVVELDRLLDALGATEVHGLEDATGSVVRGAVIVRRKNSYGIRFRPAELDARTRQQLSPLATRNPEWRHDPWKGLSYTFSDDRAAMVARITTTPVPAGGWEQNPLASVPALVGKAAKHLGVSREAAALYLQFLVLLWPAPKSLCQWNGWSAKQLDAATAELVDHELVLPAKRERAQRGHFLPGGWEALKTPHPPMETWKLPLYGTRDEQGDPVAPLGRFFAMAPFHLLFERAWQRIESGDVPRYDEVKR